MAILALLLVPAIIFEDRAIKPLLRTLCAGIVSLQLERKPVGALRLPGS